MLLRYIHCIQCGQRFSHDNVRTMAGLRETQSTGLCELCAWATAIPQTVPNSDDLEDAQSEA